MFRLFNPLLTHTREPLSLSVKADPQMAHLVLPDTQADPSQNQKSHFCHRTDEHSDRRVDNFSNIIYLEKRDIEKIKTKFATRHLLRTMNRIKEVLEEKGIKQTWLAEQLGKSYNMVNGYVQNRQQPRLEVLYEIANILNIDAKELLKTNEEVYKCK